MAGWAGFSEDELKSLKQQRGSSRNPDQEHCPPEAFLSRPQTQRKKVLQEKAQEKKTPTQKMVKLEQTRSARLQHAHSKPNNTEAVESSSTKMQKHLEPETSESLDHKPEPQNGNTDEQLSKMQMELREKSRLDQLQLEQRLMEEKNKRKKALLAKAIAERSKKTQAETLKLQRIQGQLQALDDLVSTDIGILRTRIEQACIEFSHAKKRYDRAESEFVSAKLDLHKKSQLKDHLTEHLCTIIQENELRKAKRLEELMQQLDVEADEERLELEIEVDRMLKLQEAEAKKLLLSSTAGGEQKPSETQEITCTAEKELTSTDGQELSTTENGDDKNAKETCQSPSGEGLSKTSEELTPSAHEIETSVSQ